MTKEERQVLKRMKTLISKIDELKSIESTNGTNLLPSSTEGYFQELCNIVMTRGYLTHRI